MEFALRTSDSSTNPVKMMRMSIQYNTAANEDLGTFAEYDPLTGFEPKEYHIMEAYGTLHPGILGRAAVPQ